MDTPVNTFVPIGRTCVDEFGDDAELVEIMRKVAEREAAAASRHARIQAWRQTMIDMFLAKSKIKTNI